MDNALPVSNACPVAYVLKKITSFAVAIGLALIVRRIGASVSNAWPMAVLIVLASFALMIVGILRGTDWEPKWTAALKLLAGSEFIILILLYPHWRIVLQESPILLALVAAPLIIHIVVALVRSFHFPVAQGGIAQALASNLLPKRMAPLIVVELTILARAIFCWRSPRLQEAQSAYTSYGALAPILIAVLVLSSVEIVILHLVLAQFSVNVATVVSMVGALSFVYFLGILNSLRSLPTIISKLDVLIRLGSLHEAYFSRAVIHTVTSLPPGAAIPSGTAKLSAMSSPNVLIHLKQPTALKGHFGKSRQTSLLAIHLDRGEDFVRNFT